MTDSHVLYKAACDAIGAKKVASALNLSLACTYRLCQPMEADGIRSDIDRIEQLVDVLAAHPRARPVVHLFRLHFESVFKRTEDYDSPLPLTDERLAQKAGTICNEVGDLLRTLQPGYDSTVVAKEASEVIVAVERLMKSLHQEPCNKQAKPLRTA